MFGTAGTLLVMPTFPRETGWGRSFSVPKQLPTNMHPGKQMLAQVVGFLSPELEIQMNFWAPSFHTAQSWLLWAFG